MLIRLLIPTVESLSGSFQKQVRQTLAWNGLDSLPGAKGGTK